MTHRVVTVLTHGMNAFEFSVACEVFGLARPELGVDWYDHRLAGTEGRVEMNGGWRLETPYGLEALDDADTVVVPGASPDGVPAELVSALRSAFDRGARMVSFCSGAFALAAAGILDGRPAATHWLYAAELARLHPAVRVDDAVLYVDDGQVLTSAGTAAGIDLALHIVRLDYGAEIANHVARRMVVAPHRDGGQAQFAVAPVPPTADDDLLGPALSWMTDHLDEAMTVAGLARLARTSPRTFARRFREATGTTPGRWLRHQRLARAQELLETTDLTVDAVATRVGLGSAANLREHFRRFTGTTPTVYRQRFRHSPATPASEAV